MRMQLSLFLIMFGSGLCSLAQSLTNLAATQQGNEVIVTYQLDGEKGKAYTVALYASNNNFTTPLQLVQGDVASKRILPGSNKTIKWRVLDELKNFDGDISFEIRSAVAAPLFTDITASAAKVKRGKEITISWKGGYPKDQVVVELVKDNTFVGAGSSTTSGKLVYAVPKKMKTGIYKIQLSQAGELTTSGEFSVVPKYPVWMKAASLVTVALMTVVIDDAIKDYKEKNKFPGPPDLTGD